MCIRDSFQVLRQFSPLSTGARILPVALSIAVGSILGGVLAPRIGTRAVVVSGLVSFGAAMAWIAPFLVGRIPVAALTNPPALVELFAETIVEELDFRLEAQNMLDIAAVFAGTGQRSVVVPRPHPELVTLSLIHI